MKVGSFYFLSALTNSCLFYYVFLSTGADTVQVGTGRKEKMHFTSQLSCKKNGEKIRPSIIWKARECSRTNPRRNTVQYEINERTADKFGNKYPPEEKLHMMVANKGSSTGPHTVMILDEVILPELGVEEGNSCVVLNDDFKAHSAPVVKDYVKSFHAKDDDGNDTYELVNWRTLSGGITPISQPIDAFIGKVFQGGYRNKYILYMLTAPMNEKTGHPLPPTRQLCAQWVVSAWEAIPDKLIRKAWTTLGYKSMDEAGNMGLGCRIVILFDKNRVKSLLERYMGPDAVLFLDDPENDKFGGDGTYEVEGKEMEDSD